jgi:hypothetical protein
MIARSSGEAMTSPLKQVASSGSTCDAESSSFN